MWYNGVSGHSWGRLKKCVKLGRVAKGVTSGAVVGGVSAANEWFGRIGVRGCEKVGGTCPWADTRCRAVGASLMGCKNVQLARKKKGVKNGVNENLVTGRTIP